MPLFEMGVVKLRSTGRVSTFLAHVDFVAALFVSEQELAAVDLTTV